jgi:thioredoxin-related protein
MTAEIVWEKRLGSALEQARTANKLVLAVFFSQDCAPCNRLKSLTLSTEDVREYINKYFVPLKYESGMDAEQFQRFSITAMPTIIVLDSDGNELFRKIGYFEPGIFIANLEQARGKGSPAVILPILRPLKTD